MGVSEPGGELREALEGIKRDWREMDREQLMDFNDFLAPEIESALRVTLRYLIRAKVPQREWADPADMAGLIEELVTQFSIILRDKRSEWRDVQP